MTVHPVHGVGSPALPGATSALPGGGGATASPHAAKDLVEVSAEGALLRRLAELASQSPSRFRAVMAGVEARLSAQAAVDPQRAAPLARLAERFAAAGLAGSPVPLVTEGVPRTGPAPALSSPAGAPGNTAASAATLAAAALAAGAATRAPERTVRRAYPKGGLARPAGLAPGAEEPSGGIFGALLATVTGVVEAALDAALLDAPAEEPRPEPAAAAAPARDRD